LTWETAGAWKLEKTNFFWTFKLIRDINLSSKDFSSVFPKICLSSRILIRAEGRFANRRRR